MLLADSTILIDLSRGNEAAILFCDNQRRKGEGRNVSSKMRHSKQEFIVAPTHSPCEVG